MSKPKTETQAPASQPVSLTTREVAAAMGITPKALRKRLRATEKFADHVYTRYRFASQGEVKSLLTKAVHAEQPAA